MTEPATPTSDTPATSDTPDDGAREPAASPQRRLVETISAYEVDPPPPARVRDEQPDS